jgi:arylsulfatase A-like enzyme
MVFDEFDFRIAFQNRPETVKLPELDRLANQSLFATNAYPPAGETLLSMPSLITGKLISEAHRAGPQDLMIKFGDDAETVSWRTQPNIFSRARAEGFSTAVFGWYHPYCRILGDSLNRCDWQGGIPAAQAQVDLSGRGSLPQGWHNLGWHMWTHATKAAYTIPSVTFLFPQRIDVGDLERRKQVLDLGSIYQNTEQAATDPTVDVILAHWTIPHPPNVYDRAKDEVSVAKDHSYLDNLKLVDRTLGDLRAAMERKGVWDNTVVLVTSDHWWREVWRKHKTWTPEDEAVYGDSSDRRIPFILKMPGSASTQRVAFDAPFNTVLTQDLLLAILRGEVSDANAAAAWLEKNRSIGRSRYDDRIFR